MRKIIAFLNLTLDGWMSDAEGGLDWHFNFWDAQLAEALCKQLYTADTILLGNNTYRAMANYWGNKEQVLSGARGDIILSNLLNQKQKVVVTSRPVFHGWDNTKFINGCTIRPLQQLKSRNGDDILVLGSRQLLAYLMRNDLIDGVELWYHPLAIGKGQTIFDEINCRKHFRLMNLEAFDSEVVRLSYEVIAK